MLKGELERLVAEDKVGCRTLKKGVEESRVYWRKRPIEDTLPDDLPKVAISLV